VKIHYLNCDGKAKLFSFSGHDYKEKTIDGISYMIDGGFDYIRHSITGTLERVEIKDVIKDIRTQFKWGTNYDKDNNLLDKTKFEILENLDTLHIINILSWFTNKLYKRVIKEDIDYDKDDLPIDRHWCIIHEIFIQELKYRLENGKY